MLSKADNEKITRTGPGTPMGELFRRFWLPALLSSELADADGAPVAFGLLGERLVAFRDSEGRIGVLEDRCPHRHARLYWGRNEHGGLRCVYHGWKFATDGSCLDMPAEPADSNYKDAVAARSYDAHEAGGLIWLYMGPKDRRPPFPEHEWTLLPPDHYLVTKRLQLCNYLQNLEGEIDTSHVNFLHRSIDPERDEMMPPGFLARKRFLISEAPFGMVAMAKSDFPDDVTYWRMTPFVLPSFTLIPTPVDAANTFTAAVPIDDIHTWGFTATWHHERPLNERERNGVLDGRGVHVHVDPKTFLPLANMSNDYLLDRDLQRRESFTGIIGIRNQDLAVQEDQDGPICDRESEHLGTTDRGIVGARRVLLQLADDLAAGKEPAQVQHPEAFRVRSVAIEVSASEDPVAVFKQGQPASVDQSMLGAAS